jgi:hypothetical protein
VLKKRPTGCCSPCHLPQLESFNSRYNGAAVVC